MFWGLVKGSFKRKPRESYLEYVQRMKSFGFSASMITSMWNQEMKDAVVANRKRHASRCPFQQVIDDLIEEPKVCIKHAVRFYTPGLTKR